MAANSIPLKTSGGTKPAPPAMTTTDVAPEKPSIMPTQTPVKNAAPSVPPKKSAWARNNLAIIAGATVLLYAVAGAAIILAPLQPLQRTPLIWLLFAFPLLAVVILGWLTARYGTKLYVEPDAPPVDEAAITLLTPEQQQRKFNLDIAALVQETAQQTGYSPDAETIQVMRSDYLMAEDLVLRRLDLEHNGTLRRHISIEGTPYDAVAVSPERIRAIEVKFLPTPEVRQETIDALLDKAEYTAQRLRRTASGKKFYLLLALVVEVPERERLRLRENLLNKFGVASVNIELEFFDYGELQKIFAAENLLV